MEMILLNLIVQWMNALCYCVISWANMSSIPCHTMRGWLSGHLDKSCVEWIWFESSQTLTTSWPNKLVKDELTSLDIILFVEFRLNTCKINNEPRHESFTTNTKLSSSHFHSISSLSAPWLMYWQFDIEVRRRASWSSLHASLIF